MKFGQNKDKEIKITISDMPLATKYIITNYQMYFYMNEHIYIFILCVLFGRTGPPNR